jgi:uncharacterized membrane protein YqiK
MALLMLVIGLILALAIIVAVVRLQNKALRTAGVGAAIGVLLVFVLLGSVTYVGADEVGIVTKNALGASLQEGKILAVNGEMGVQADVLPPGWHAGYWPILYTVKTVPLVEVRSDEIGLIETADGLSLEDGQLFAPDWKTEEVRKMLDARHFLTDGKGRKGKQATVLTPGKYRLNTELYKIKMVKQTEVLQGEVAVLKANYGMPPTVLVHGIAGAIVEGKDAKDENQLRLAKEGEMGVRAEVLPPGKYPLNTDAFTVTEVWTTQMIAHYAAANAGNPISSRDGVAHDPATEERAITVRTSDGFTFPVDVRVEYVIEPSNAPIVVAKLGDDEGDRFRNMLNSAVRAIFRNNAEGVRALDYVQQRSHQESQSLQMLATQMARYGVTVTAVRIGNVGDEQSLGSLLKTQTEREIAKQEQLTFQEQQKAAEQKKLLTRTTQESEEERRLATATYAVKIAAETQKQKVAEAEGEAQAIKIKAQAQANAYELIAQQIGKSNAAMIELLKIVGEKNIQITPRIMIHGGGGGGGGADGAGMNAALTGTILDAMVKDEPTPNPAAKPNPPAKPN